jgi:hypothetical protein
MQNYEGRVTAYGRQEVDKENDRRGNERSEEKFGDKIKIALI